MAKWRKKPVVIEADVYKLGMEDAIECIVPAVRAFNKCENSNKCKTCNMMLPVIHTLEGNLVITEGDYIITGIKGERYPCKPDIFHTTYEPVAEVKTLHNQPPRQEDLDSSCGP